MACAFGMEACKHYYSVRFVRLPDLLLELQAAREDGVFQNVLKKYTTPTLLIIDEWLLLRLNESEARNLFELINVAKEHPPSSVHSSEKKTGTTESVVVNRKTLWPMQSWTESHMIPTR